MNNIPVKNKISFENTEIAFSSKSNFNLKKTYWLFYFMNLNWLVKIGTAAINFAFKIYLPIKPIVKNTIFSQFCGGENIEDCENSIKKLSQYHIGTILDYSVEGEKSEKNFDETAKELLLTIEKAAKMRMEIPFSVFKVTGVADFDLLEKIQDKKKLSDSEEISWEKAKQRVKSICQLAYDKKVRVFIDAEESWIQGTIDALVDEMMRLYNKEQAIVYNTYQMYAKASLQNLKNDFEKAEKDNFIVGAKLVRGAYMEKETKRAEEKKYPNPIQNTKQDSDDAYNQSLLFCVQNRHRFAICAGTHNEESSLYLVDLMQNYKILPNDTRFFFAQLYGMSDHISYNLAQAGYNVAKYVPYGPVKSVLPYLFRRANENTSVKGQSSREFNLIKQEVKRRKSIKK
ncbi:MAG: proline dehydrogenase [Bacteroidetes bacterium]|nr:MAG: proline dehydrogenase [Bacteroidota bacterium]TAG92564.1 MAG: proline dehydrogenase [Bacteroidota bacterium]